MLESLRKQLEDLKKNPPWQRKDSDRVRNFTTEGTSAPEPGEFRLWKNAIRRLSRRVRAAAEEDARQQIDRP